MQQRFSPPRIALAALFLYLLTPAFAAIAQEPTKVGIEKRVPWTTSRITGSPEPPPPYRTEQVFAKLKFENPVELVQVPGSDRLMIAELSGKVYSFPARPEVAQADLTLDLSKIAGMTRAYGLAFHPDFERNRYCYLCYVLEPKLPEGTRVSRFTVSQDDPPRIDLASEQIVITWRSGGHNGGSLQFGPDRMLYISAGDGGESFPPDGLNSGQDLSNLLASVMRIDVDREARYNIPRDNPFVDMPGARGEIWAYGMRNPWKMSFDPSGALWVGDVGWELWEMLYRVQRGANYGWSVVEGSQPVLGERQRGPTPIVPPTVEHSHTEARSITGGYVSTSSRLPELQGAYIYGDYVTGKVWGLRHDGEKVVWKQELVDTPLALVCFGLDRTGEVILVDYDTGTLHRLVKRSASEVNLKFPTKLSETGLFADTARHELAPGVIPYSINAEAWADGTQAERFVALPGLSKLSVYEKENVQIGHVKGMWRFPRDGVLVKTVKVVYYKPSYESLDSLGRRRLETQILHYDGDDWHAYTYLWNDAQTDAELVPAEGLDLRLLRRADAVEVQQVQSLTERSAVATTTSPDSLVRQQTYRVSARTECILCHTTRGGSIYGFLPQQLNRDHNYAGTSANQLQTLAHLGLFEQPVDLHTPPLPNPADPAGDLEPRARAYLHINCGHCHRRGGGGSAFIDLRYELPLAKTNVLSRPTQGTFGIHGAQVVYPGDPARSVLVYRMAKLGRGRMPHFGSGMVDYNGLELIEEWIMRLYDKHKPAGDDKIAPLRTLDRRRISNLIIHGPTATLDADLDQILSTTSGALALARSSSGNYGKIRTRFPNEQVVAKGLAHPDAQIRDLFEPFLPEEQRVQRLGSAVRAAELLALPGNTVRGQMLFFEGAGITCRNCHRLNAKGIEVGPDLSQIGKKLTKPQLLESILEPSKAVDPKYVAWIVETTQGEVHVGLLSRRTGQEVVLRDALNKEHRIAAADIEVIVPQRQSLMPELLLREMTPQDVADLLEFLAGLKDDAKPQAAVSWKIDNLESIGGHTVTVLGQPRVVETPQGKAVEFDGVDDGLIVDNHPLAGVKEFTAEVIFRPAAGGPKEQRFFHLQETGSENRVLFETRLDGQQWFLDTYIKSGPADATLFAENSKHPLGPWYHAAIVVDGQTMKHYVDGKLELEKPLTFQPHQAGQTSIGVRHNRVFWYQGAIRTARFTPRVLKPEEFLKP